MSNKNNMEIFIKEYIRNLIKNIPNVINYKIKKTLLILSYTILYISSYTIS